LTFALAANVLAQQSNYPIVEENGQKYYIYTVEPKEGLYAVSHKFNVTQASILACNPDISDGLKTGEKIKIPIISQSTGAASAIRHHTVLKKQTLYSIAYQYGVSVAAIVAQNPDAAHGIHEGEILQIPAQLTPETTVVAPEPTIHQEVKATPKVTTVPQPSVIKKKSISHEVEAGETFYSLSRKYNVTVTEIKNANPTVEMLKVGETVIIPSDTLKATAKNTIPAQTHPQPAPRAKNDSSKHIVRVAMLLPFSLDGEKEDPTIDKFVDFYRGALLALEKLKEQGISVDVHTYDVAKTAAAVNKILTDEPVLTQVDLIIGPAYAGQIKPVADFAKVHKIHTVIPFTQKVEGLENNPYLFQFNTSPHTQFTQAAILFARQFKNSSIVIARLPDSGTSDEGVLFAECLEEKLKLLKINYHTVTLQEGSVQAITPWLTTSKPTIVVLANANGEKIAPYLSAFAGLNTDSKHVALYGFTGWEPETNVYPNLYFSSLFYTHDRDILTDFNRQYNQWFHQHATTSDAMRFDLLGYDLTLFFVEAINKYGVTGFTQQLNFQLPDNIQSRFSFKRVAPTGGYLNHELHLLNFQSTKGITLISEW
jgi:LysM repeat protein